MSKIVKKEIVRALPETGEPDIEYFVPSNWLYPEDGGTTYIWRLDTWCPISISHTVSYYRDGIMNSAYYKELMEGLAIARGTDIVRCQADSLYADIMPDNPLVGITSNDICFVQRKTSTTVENATCIIASECLDNGNIRVYFNKKSTSVFYVNYIVFRSV